MDFWLFFLIVGVIALIIGGDRNFRTMNEKMSDIEFEIKYLNETMKEFLQSREED